MTPSSRHESGEAHVESDDYDNVISDRSKRRADAVIEAAHDRPMAGEPSTQNRESSS
jgi:hypothetical protein